MGKIQILTKEQHTILDEIKQESYLQKFYFTGGTALSAIYLQHRYSEDLDFFSESKLDTRRIFAIVNEWATRNHFTFTSEFQEVVYIFILNFKNTNLKLDFGFYPYKRIEKNQSTDGINIDSITDIAVNKLLSITQRSEVKDFVDLYFLLQKFTVWDLLDGIKIKFRLKMEPFILASDFLKVEGFEYLPKMIKPLKLETLKIFFRNKAKEIGRRSVT